MNLLTTFLAKMNKEKEALNVDLRNFIEHVEVEVRKEFDQLEARIEALEGKPEVKAPESPLPPAVEAPPVAPAAATGEAGTPAAPAAPDAQTEAAAGAGNDNAGGAA